MQHAQRIIRHYLPDFGHEPNIIAIDEVGRGCGAGPVVVCASLWQPYKKKNENPQKNLIAKVNDSKKITPKNRMLWFSELKKVFENKNDFNYLNFSELSQTDLNITFEQLKNSTHVIKLKTKDILDLEELKFENNLCDYECVYFSVKSSTPKEVDDLNIWNATQLASARALCEIWDQLCVEGSGCTPNNLKTITSKTVLFVDGHMPFKSPPQFQIIPQITVTGGDAALKCIGFSSLVAKVLRDTYMEQICPQFPEFGFSKHKGYLTPEHIEMIKKKGLTPMHRTSFTGNIFN